MSLCFTRVIRPKKFQDLKDWWSTGENLRKQINCTTLGDTPLPTLRLSSSKLFQEVAKFPFAKNHWCVRSCPTPSNPMDYTVHGLLQARTLEWYLFPSPGDLPNPGIELGSPALQLNSLPTEISGKPSRRKEIIN